ncbi:lipopolysaccharide heptosyltransferase family protein [Flavobacterium sp. LMO8]|uniref:glycosyltransferase family 9 protein n=1 Tax=Flavobacterium sp. LMO8 TaxID=2654244 RepID=UPI001292A330|nr:glycosyltransferase family 9 protein [Flavobacterium sp. LMO8]MQP25427.1 lipopolysaccharide heptosyltransferase family protein [Flavobacterium sp. LMO8]
MNLKEEINLFRKSITKNLFVKTINETKSYQNSIKNPSEIKKILIVRPNHRLGNQLLITPLLQELITTFPDAKIDLFLKGNLGSILFKNYPEVNKIISLPRKHFKEFIKYLGCWLYLRKHKYDLIINTVSYSSSGSIATKITKSKYKIFGRIKDLESSVYNDYLHNAKRPVYDFREEIKILGLELPDNSIPKINIRLDSEELKKGANDLFELTGNTKKTICIFTYATSDKKYTKEWWTIFYEVLKKEFNNYTIIEVLPAENVSQINFKAPSYYSKDVRKIAALIANTELFIGADSGIMHLSNSTNTTTIGLFSVTEKKLYQPYHDNNFGIDTNGKEIDAILKEVKTVIQ